MRSIGLEGIHRALQNPSNYGNRWIKYNLKFLKLFFRELSGKKSAHGEYDKEAQKNK